jgi:hypothetical protein
LFDTIGIYTESIRDKIYKILAYYINHIGITRRALLFNLAILIFTLLKKNIPCLIYLLLNL